MIFPMKHLPNNQFILIIRITTRQCKIRKNNNMRQRFSTSGKIIFDRR